MLLDLAGITAQLFSNLYKNHKGKQLTASLYF